MPYSELIKNFEKIRSYMREFFVYGFRSRGEFDRKSARSYDNERRRVESWLGDYMAFRQDENGKAVFLSVDSRTIARNPIYRAFQAKSFTDNALTLHFWLLDLLADGEARTVSELVRRIDTDFLSQFPDSKMPDESTVRKKLKEYESLGILKSEKQGRELAFRLNRDGVPLDRWTDALTFFSETDPLGVIGDSTLSQLQAVPDYFRFKHHYLLHAMDSEILYELLLAIREHRKIDITALSRRKDAYRESTVYPMRIYLSAQTGRQYLLCWHYRWRKPMFYRIDGIISVVPGEIDPDPERYERWHEGLLENLWGVSIGRELSLDHIEMTVRVAPEEGYILDRLDREKRCGRVEVLGGGLFRYVADVFDALEMLPWLRTFIGRVVSLECSNHTVVDTFWSDYQALCYMYGGDENDLP